MSEFQQLEEVTKKLAKVTDEPGKLPAASEAVISDMTSGNVQGDGNGLTGPHFQTPPSSPSSLGSRKSSMCSISSAGSSGVAGQGSSPSHHPSVNNARLRSQVLYDVFTKAPMYCYAFIYRQCNVNLHISCILPQTNFFNGQMILHFCLFPLRRYTQGFFSAFGL